MLGYGVVAPEYPYEMPTTMAAAGYETIAIGKDHFGWNATTNEGIAHGFKTRSIYDGLGNGLPSSNDTNGFDTYDQWFQKQMPGKDPMATGLDWNTWHGKGEGSAATRPGSWLPAALPPPLRGHACLPPSPAFPVAPQRSSTRSSTTRRPGWARAPWTSSTFTISRTPTPRRSSSR